MEGQDLNHLDNNHNGNDVTVPNQQHSLLSLIQNDIDSLSQRFKTMSNGLNKEGDKGRNNPFLSINRISPELVVFLEEGFKESLYNATKLKDELTLALIKDEEASYDALLFSDEIIDNEANTVLESASAVMKEVRTLQLYLYLNRLHINM